MSLVDFWRRYHPKREDSSPRLLVLHLEGHEPTDTIIEWWRQSGTSRLGLQRTVQEPVINSQRVIYVGECTDIGFCTAWPHSRHVFTAAILPAKSEFFAHACGSAMHLRPVSAHLRAWVGYKSYFGIYAPEGTDDELAWREYYVELADACATAQVWGTMLTDRLRRGLLSLQTDARKRRHRGNENALLSELMAESHLVCLEP